MITKEELEFLRESNNIENEWDDKSLQDAIIAWQYCKKQRKMSKGTIMIVHRMLMESRDTLPENQKGIFRNGPVWIGGHEATPFYAVDNLLDQWVGNVNSRIAIQKQQLPLLEESKLEEDAKGHHVQYEGIHPFFDGNGRTGRIFYNWERIKLGLPIHVIHVGKEQMAYYRWFK